MEERKLPRPIDYGFRALAAVGLFASTACASAQAANNVIEGPNYTIEKIGSNFLSVKSRGQWFWEDQPGEVRHGLSVVDSQCAIRSVQNIDRTHAQVVLDGNFGCLSKRDASFAIEKHTFERPYYEIVQGKRLIVAKTEDTSTRDITADWISNKCTIISKDNTAYDRVTLITTDLECYTKLLTS